MINNGHWNELCEQCKKCLNLQIMSLKMDGNHYYYCPKYHLHDANQPCPRFEEETGEEDGEEIGLQEDG